MFKADDYRLKIQGMRGVLAEAGYALDLDNQKKKLEELKAEQEKPEVWQDLERSTKIGREIAHIQNKITAYDKSAAALSDAEEVIDLIEETGDESLISELDSMLSTADKDIEDMRIRAILKGPYDSHNALLTLHAGAGGSVPGLGVGGAAGGRKALLFQVGQLTVQKVGLLGQAAGAVRLLLQLQVVGLQAAQPLGQALLLGGQGGFQLVRCQLGGGLARIAVPAAGEKSICVALQCRAQLMRVGSGVTGGAAGGGRCAALGRQLLLALLQLLFGDVVLGQGRDLGVAGRAADRAGLALFQIAGQQASAVGVKLALQRAVLLLGLVQRGLRRHIGSLAVFGVLPGLVGVLQLA